MASTVFMIVTLAMATREQFVTNLNELVGPSLGVPDAYNAIIASGKEKGWGEAGFDLWQTILVSNWPFLPLIGAAFSIAIGGEIKSVAKSQSVGMLGAVLCATLAFVITVWLAYGCSASSSSAPPSLTFSAATGASPRRPTRPSRC